MVNCVEKYNTTFENKIINQDNLDNYYNLLCKVLTKEMDKHLKFADSNKRIRKKHKNSKPYWCEELSNMWRNMRDSEKKFSKYRGPKRGKQELHQKFKIDQLRFDKRFKAIRTRT